MDYYFILQGLPRLARTYSITTEILQKLDRCLDTLNGGQVYKGFNEHTKPIELLITLTLDEWDRQKVEMMGQHINTHHMIFQFTDPLDLTKYLYAWSKYKTQRMKLTLFLGEDRIQSMSQSIS